MIIAYLIAVLLFAVLFAIGVLYNSLSWGVVLWCFWDWFLLPVFPDLHALTFWRAVGLMFIIDLFKNQIFPAIPTFKKELIENDGKTNQGIATLAAPWVVLIIGFFMQMLITAVS